MTGSNVVDLRDRLPEPSITPFDVYHPSAWEGTEAKQIDWFVDGCIPRNAVTLLAGAGELGKSYLIQQLMVCSSIGIEWLGRKTTPCKSFAMFSEDGEIPLRLRQDAIIKHYGASHADMDRDLTFLDADCKACENPKLMATNKFGNELHPTTLFEQIEDYCKEEGKQLVFFDTASTTFGGKPNDPGQVTEYIRMLTRLARAIDGAVVLTIHPPKDGSSWFGGASAWRDSARSAMSLERPRGYDEETGDKADERLLRTRKGNYTGNRTVIPLRWSDGVFVPEELVERKRSLTAQEKHDLDYRMLSGLRRMTIQGIIVPADERAPYSLPRYAKRITPEFRDYPLIWLVDSLERLIAIGHAVRVLVGRTVAVRPSDMKLPGEQPWEAI